MMLDIIDTYHCQTYEQVIKTKTESSRLYSWSTNLSNLNSTGNTMLSIHRQVNSELFINDHTKLHCLLGVRAEDFYTILSSPVLACWLWFSSVKLSL